MILEVAVSADDKFYMQMGITITSLLETNQDYFDKINIHILNNEISDENIRKLSVIEKKYEKLNYKYYDVKFIKDIIPEANKFNSANHLGFSSYSRLFLGKIIKNIDSSDIKDDIDKILYLDSDVLINCSLFEFYNQDLKDSYLLGVIDTLPYFVQEKWGLNTETVFINSGVLLINLKKWINNNTEEKFIDSLKELEKFSPNMIMIKI